MRWIHYSWLIFFSLLVATTAFAQKPRLKQAKKYMAKGDYRSAVELYLEILDKNEDSEAKIGIAECYRNLKNPDETEYWYGQVVLLPNAEPVATFYYAQALLSNGKYKKAKEWAERYVRNNPADTRGQFLLKACNEEVVLNLRASGALYKVEHVKELNSKYDDFCAVYYKEDRLVFVSSREQKASSVVTDARTGQSFTALYSSKIKLEDAASGKYSYTKPEKYAPKLNSKYNDGPVSFNADGSEVYFSRNNMEGRSDDKIVRLKIYKSTGSDESWASPQSLPFNSEEYSVMHPALSKDNMVLFFASNMPGGFGGMDLYVSYFENGRWSPPVNLGPSINTEGDEAFPFHHEDGTLYFSSNGHTGLGGMDIYLTKESFGSWSEPTNLGYPINTTNDDFGIVLNKNKTHGYFASNRSGGLGGDDIYTFNKLSVEVEVLVVNKANAQPLEGAEVFTSCSSVKSFTTNADGKVLLEIGLDKACDFAAEKTPFKPNSVRKSTRELAPGDKLFVQIDLELERFFDLGGKIIDGYSKKPIDGALVSLEWDCDGEKNKQTTSTDAEGRYEFKELREDCDFLLKVRKLGFTEGATTFETRKIDSQDPLQRDLAINCLGPDCPKTDIDIDSPIIVDPNNECPTCPKKIVNGDTTLQLCANGTDTLYLIVARRNKKGVVTKQDTLINNKKKCLKGGGIKPFEKNLINIYYDFDAAALRDDAQPGLEALVRIMKENPNIEILITSHTDARGTKMYNNRLSNRRAESVVRYLISNGIPKKRFKARGDGEAVMINDCYDGKECTEEQHQENRRSEFQIVGTDQKSKRPEKVNVNPCTNCDKTAPVEGTGEPKGETFNNDGTSGN